MYKASPGPVQMQQNTAFILLFPAKKWFYYIVSCKERGIRNKSQYLKGTLLPHIMQSGTALRLSNSCYQKTGRNHEHFQAPNAGSIFEYLGERWAKAGLQT